MGTSASSMGPGKGVAFDPPWLDGAIEEIGVQLEAVVEPQVQPAQAGSGRFTVARRNLGEYVAKGRERFLKKAIGNYVRNGLGGSARATARMRLATAVGAKAFTILRDLREGGSSSFKDEIKAILDGEHTITDVVSAVVNHVIESGGSADEESCRDAMAEALSEALQKKSDLDLLNVLEEDLWWLMELFVGKIILRQIFFDIGQIFEKDVVTPDIRVSRVDAIVEFVESYVSVQVKEARNGNPAVSQKDICKIIRDAVRLTFDVFGRMR